MGTGGAWTSRSLTGWKHTTELLVFHAGLKCYNDAAVTVSMAQQAGRGKPFSSYTGELLLES